MTPEYVNGNVRSNCPDCGGAVTTFEYKDHSHEFGAVVVDKVHHYLEMKYTRAIYRLVKCAGCGRGGLAKIHCTERASNGVLEWFFPQTISAAKLPPAMPAGVVSEFREAEVCAGAGSWRGGSGLLRSTLEKLLKANGYVKGSLAARIDEAAADGVITEARRKRAHDEIRVLGNDVMHDEWRVVARDEFELSHHYVQRIAEDLYDDRGSVEAILRLKGRIQ
jgi:hypothetical protein